MTFNLFLVMMNVFEAESGSSLKPSTVCWAAQSTLVMFTAASRWKSAVDSDDSGSLASPTTRTQAVKIFSKAIHVRAGEKYHCIRLR